MKGGNLSAQKAPGVGLRFEACVYNFGKVNPPGKAFLEKLLNIDCNMYLVSLLPDRKVKAWCYKWAIPYTQVLAADSVLEIPQLCQAHHLTVYYDTDERILEAVRSRGNPQVEALKWEQQ